MIRCTPKGVCSWDFRLEGEGHSAVVEFDWLGERGAITADGVAFEVRKHGVFSGRWTLDRDGGAEVTAQKSSAFTRTFEIEGPGGTVLLSAESAFGRSFQVERLGEVVAAIRPDHAFTRRATIELPGRRGDFPTLCFAFWLVVLTWRRAASSSSGASAGS